MATDDLTTTSYAILGLLALKPWTAYELAKQMERSLRAFWPRAESRIYEEPKRLAALGLAKARTDSVGRRPRTTYSITAKGRRALARWLDAPVAVAAPVLEYEPLVKLFFSEHGSKESALAHVAAMREWIERRAAENVAFARSYLADGGPFPDRLAQIVLIGRFHADFTDMLAAWVEWAAAVVDGWPATTGAEPDWATLEAVATRGQG